MLKTTMLSKILITFVVFSVLFCSSQEKNQTKKNNELTFDVDSTKLELTRYEQELGIQFNPPKEWKPIPQSLFEAFSKKISSSFAEGNDFTVNPVSIFLNQQNKSSLYISLFQNVEDSVTIEKYKELIQETFSPTKIGNFLKDDILFTQYLIQDEIQINFKLLFYNSRNQLIQFDYIVPNESYLSELKAIESSIGSIKLLDLTQTSLFEGIYPKKSLTKASDQNELTDLLIR